VVNREKTMTHLSTNLTNRALAFICITVALHTNGIAQLVVSVSTDKPTYQYGEAITLTGTLTNQADTAVMVGQDYQGPVGLVLFDNTSLPKSFILPTHWQYQYSPHMSYRSVFKIDGSRLGLPNKEGQHFLVCCFSWDVNGSSFSKRDSVMISQPVFYGGQLLLEYSVHTPPSEIQSLLDSMKATVISSQIYSETVAARWQISGFLLDSLVARYTGDSRLSAIVADRHISPPTTVALENHKPVLVSYSPRMVETHLPNAAYKFLVRANDPDGDMLVYTWKLDRVTVQSSRDSTYTMIYTDPLKPPHTLNCVFSDPGGLKDSIMWSFDYNAVPGDPGSVPEKFSLDQNYPNPFNPSTTISYGLPTTSRVTIRVFNALGQEVAVLVDGEKQAGMYQVRWTAHVPSGVYFYKIQTARYSECRKMVVLR
jgi:hypothetical protein